MKKYILLFAILAFSFAAHADGKRALAVLFDVSRSVPPAEFQHARDEIRHMVEQSPPRDTILIYTFGNRLQRIDAQKLKTLQPTESNTLLYDGVYDAAQELARQDAERKAILIVSDGNDTRSVTVLEDTVSFARTQGISIYSVGIGKVNRKSLERIAKLTDGKVYSVADAGWVASLGTNVDAQRPVSAKPEPEQPAVATQKTPVSAPALPPASQPAQRPAPVSTEPAPKRFSFPFRAFGIAAGVLVLGAVLFMALRSFRKEPRVCPTCGRALEEYQTICPACPTVHMPVPEPAVQPEKPRTPDSTQEIRAAAQPQAETDEDLIPLELLEKKPVTEESLTKTFVLMETPLLVVRKGRNLGENFSLNRAFPVTIGRSRVCEIKLDDITISGQHCRIVPENGKHVLCDLGSTNGTFVNEKRVHKVILKEGDIIKVGETQFLYKVEQHRN